MEWEISIIEFIQNGIGTLCKVPGDIFSFIGSETGLMILIVVTLFCFKKQVGQRLALIIACLHAWFSMIKALVRRPRPYVQYPDRVKAISPSDPEAPALAIVAQGYSFPSMHSGAIPASYFTLAEDIKKKWAYIFAAVLSFLVGFFRVATGNHYPTDVMAGWILGLGVLGVFGLLDKYVKKQWVRHLILLVSALPGIIFVRTSDYYTSLGLLMGAIIAIPYEQKYVNYQDTRYIPVMIIRAIGAFVIYFGLNTLLKLPFAKEFLAADQLSALLIRTIRYAIIMFVIIGVYPKVFPFFDKIKGNKK